MRVITLIIKSLLYLYFTILCPSWGNYIKVFFSFVSEAGANGIVFGFYVNNFNVFKSLIDNLKIFLDISVGKKRHLPCVPQIYVDGYIDLKLD